MLTIAMPFPSSSRLTALLSLPLLACSSHPVSTAGHDAAGSGSGSTSTDSGVAPFDASTPPGPECNGTVKSTGTATTPTTAPALTVPAGFTLEAIASISTARQLVALPNGDLLVSTRANEVWIVPNAEGSGAPYAPVVFATINDVPVQGIAFDPTTCTIAIGSQHGIYSVPYRDAQTTGTIGPAIAQIRTGPTAHSVDASVDTDTHITTSLAYAGGKLYAAVGSSCNACVEVDSTRATVQEMNLDGTGMVTRATRIRNAIAMAVNPATGTVWLGGAGQDDLAIGHPYEYFDALTLHPGVADYGWPDCEENRVAYVAGADCSNTVEPMVEFPAYSTLIGATFYPAGQTGAYAFPDAFRGGVFVTAHGSWHTNADQTYYSPPRVAYVAMTGDTPATAADWQNPKAQWQDFVTGFQLSDGVTRVGRPTGIAVGVEGTLFVADDQTNQVYRVRPQ